MLYDVTNPIATINTAAVGSFPYGVAIKSGTASVVNTGTANLTVTYR